MATQVTEMLSTGDQELTTFVPVFRVRARKRKVPLALGV
jgi:hypothetical protein